MIVDAHQHFWDPAVADYTWMDDELGSLRRRFDPDDLSPLLAAHGVRATVVVQALGTLDETRWLLELAAAAPFVAGVVGWIDLTGDAKQGLDGLVGVRHQVHDEPDPNWLVSDDVQRGLAAIGDAGLPFDLVVRPEQLPAAVEAVRRNPANSFVLDHVGNPPLRSGEVDQWRDCVAALAELPNVTCKLSGLFTLAKPGGDLAAVVEQALRWFGAERCMFGSDWPVCLLATDYGAALALVRDAVPERDRERVLSGTAIRTYGLKVA